MSDTILKAELSIFLKQGNASVSSGIKFEISLELLMFLYPHNEFFQKIFFCSGVCE
jgi:hypothetical protein